jgi:hypothetical protein
MQQELTRKEFLALLVESATFREVIANLLFDTKRNEIVNAVNRADCKISAIKAIREFTAEDCVCAFKLNWNNQSGTDCNGRKCLGLADAKMLAEHIRQF